MTAKRSAARVVLGVLAVAVLAGCAGGPGESDAVPGVDSAQLREAAASVTGDTDQTKAVRVLEPARRLALVIGNAAYAKNRLANPEGDAELIETTLKGLGFDEVVRETNLKTLPALRGAVREFGQRLRANDMAFFYYSGHGQQAPGGDREETQNYLLPTGYDWETPLDEVEDNALSFERVRRMLGGAQLRVMVLDACRKYKQGKSGGGGGLAPTVAASGELIAYATEPDAVATDKGAGAGIYAQELSGALRQPGVEVAEVFRNAMEGVVERTEGGQHPEHMPKIVGRLYLNGPPETIDSRQPWIREWQDLEGIEDPAMGGRVAAYIKKYGDEARAREWVAKAGVRLAKLEGLVAEKPVVDPPPPPVEGRWIRDWQALEGIEDPALKGAVEAYIKDYKEEGDARVWVAKAEALLAKLEEVAAIAGGPAGTGGQDGVPRVPVAGSTWKSPLGMEFAWVPAGEFEMGSPEGEAGRYGDEVQHGVRISEGFWMGRYEVTQGEWEAVMGANPSMIQACGPRCPVEQVSWFDAQEFIRRLNRRESGSGYEYRLPTEAEWEYAARAGSKGATPEGELRILGERNAPVLDGQAWYGGNSGVRYADAFDCSGWEGKQYAAERCGPHAVGQKRGNAWGLHDMLGNVWEWTGDWFGGYPSGTVTDPRGPSTGSTRVVRGGGWNGDAGNVRSAIRGVSSPGDRYDTFGFRLVRTK